MFVYLIVTYLLLDACRYGLAVFCTTCGSYARATGNQRNFKFSPDQAWDRVLKSVNQALNPIEYNHNILCVKQ